MFAIYSSVSRLLSWNKTDVVISKNSYKSVDPAVTEIKNNLDMMFSPYSSRDVIETTNDKEV